MRAFYKAPVVLLLISLSVIGQTESSKAGSITGRVVNENGQPLPHARVSVAAVQQGSSSGRTKTRRDGTFRVTGLDPVPYRILIDVPGYLRIGEQGPELGPSGRQYKVGDSVTFTFVRGGVITGTVTNATGDPVIGIAVRARRIRDQKDQRPAAAVPFSREITTDDRGVYRIYGLPAGTYTVAAGGPAEFNAPTFGAFDTFLPTYAPSASTRDGALEISVRAGEETSNVDITFRAEMGKTVSGTVSGPGTEGGFGVSLTTVAPAGSQSNVSRFNQPGNSQFTFQAVADGDYYLTVRSQAESGELLLSEPKLIRMRGADIEDVDLTVKAMGSVSGRVLLEESRATECQGKQAPAYKEMFISAWHKDSEAARNLPQFIWSAGPPVNPDAQGNFTIRNLAPSQYYFVARFPVRSWYLKSIAMSPPAAARAGKPSDVTRVWTNVKTGDRLSGLIVTLAQGAALFQGQVGLPEGETNPEKLFVYLVPSEREAADELLRFYGGNVGKDGKIGPYSLAPGRYWILVQQASETGPFSKMRLPDGSETRAQLRRDAEAAKLEIELKACQSVVDFRVPVN